MKRLLVLIVATVTVMCGLGAVVTDPRLGAAFGLPADPFPDSGANGVSCGPDKCPPGGDWTAPVPHGIVSGYRTAGRPGHDGVDLGAPRGTSVRAAAAGVVTQAECQATLNGGWYGCDRDGSPQVQGCGWHVTIAHAHNALTVYCHFVQQPDVTIGDKVTVGDVIGTSGTSGNSSGPHLHLEVHDNHVWEPSSAVNPVAFFNGKGVRL